MKCDVAHSAGSAVLDHGGDVLEHPHACSNVVGMMRKHAHTADVRRLVKTFQGSLRSPADRVMMSVCAAASMLMTGAMLPGVASAAATDGCRLLAAILAHDLETLRVLPRKSSGLVVSGRCLPLGGRSGPAVNDILAS